MTIVLFYSLIFSNLYKMIEFTITYRALVSRFSKEAYTTEVTVKIQEESAEWQEILSTS